VPLNSDRSKRLDFAVQQSSAASEMGKQPVVIGGIKEMLSVYKLSTDLLAFNIRNGRFVAELEAREKQLGRRLDPLVAEDQQMIRNLLIELDPAATEALKRDLKSVGQTSPGIITHDGYVINGNRRMAILQILHNDEPTGKFQYLEVHRLPPDVGEKDLWRIEAGLQLSRDSRLEYGPVNDLLKIRQGINAGLTYDEIAATLYGITGPEEVQEKDKRLVLIESYLEYIGDPRSHNRVKGFVEHFINLQDFLKWLDKQSVKATERQKWLLRAFELIRAGVPHMEIRRLRAVALSEAAKKHFLASIQPKEGARTQEQEQKTRENVTSEFDIVKDYVELDEQAKKPEQLLNKAIRALETLLNHKSDIAANADLHDGIASIQKMAGELTAACSKKIARKRS